MKRELIPLNEIGRKEAATYAQYLTDGDAVAWLYMLEGQYSEFTYRQKKYPNAVVPAKDGYYRVRNPASLVRALMKFSIEGESGLVYPGQLANETGEPFEVTLDEVRFDKHGKASYQVDPEGNAELAGFSLAHFSLEVQSSSKQQESHAKQVTDQETTDFLEGVRNDNCNIAILTYLKQCAETGNPPSPEMCWENTKEKYASNYGDDWMVFAKMRYPDKTTLEIHRENFNRRYSKILANLRRPD